MKVVVGEGRTEFGIHKGLLCEYSEYFEAALNGNFTEAETGVVELLDEEISTFEVFHTWLYSKKLVVEEDGQEQKAGVPLIVRLYIFGDRRGVRKLRNDCINALVVNMNCNILTYVVEELEHIYENTSPGSSLRRLVEDSSACAHLESILLPRESRPFLPNDFLISVLIARGRTRGLSPSMKPPWAVDLCQYHEHAQSEESYGVDHISKISRCNRDNCPREG